MGYPWLDVGSRLVEDSASQDIEARVATYVAGLRTAAVATYARSGLASNLHLPGIEPGSHRLQ